MAKTFSLAMGCGAKCIQICLVIFNLIFFILGGAILGIGIYVLADPKFVHLKALADYAANNGVNLSYLDKCGIAFCVIGGIMVLISFLGCCGAMMQVRCLLIMYAVVLLLILLAEIGIAIFASVFWGRLTSIFTPLLTQSISDQYMGNMDNKTLVSIAWDAVMYNVQCCGVNNGSDFTAAAMWTSRNGMLVPPACCKFSNLVVDWSGQIPNVTNPNYPACVYTPTDNNSNYNIGCLGKIEAMIGSYSYILIGVAVGVAFALLLGVICSLYFAKRVDEMRDYA